MVSSDPWRSKLSNTVSRRNTQSRRNCRTVSFPRLSYGQFTCVRSGHWHTSYGELLTLLRDDAVGPFYERDEDRRVAELGPPLIQICLQNRPRAAAGAAGINLNMAVSNFCEGLL